MPYIITSPFPSFNDTDGSPLNNGYVYVGSANLNPVTDPIPVYWDAALTQPAAQPIRTINGYLSRNGSPGRIYTNFITYSFRVTNNKGEQVFSDLNYTDPTSSAGSTYQQVITAIAGQTVFNLSRTYIPGTNNLFVYRNGLRLIVGQDYNETGYSQVTLTAGADNGDEFVFDIGYNYDSAASVDAQDVTYKLPAVDSVFTNVEAKLSEIVSVKDFGAVGDGATDDTDKIQAAINAANSVFFPWGIYKCKDIVVGTHKSLYCNGSIFRPAAGANWVFKLVNFKPALFDAYFDGSSDPIPNDLAHAAVMVGDDTVVCKYSLIQNCTWVNHTLPLLIGGNDSYAATQGMVTNCNLINFASRGILIKKNALDFTFTDINIRAGTVAVSGGSNPKTGAIGFQHVGTGTTIGRGGHLLNSIASLESETGFQFTDSELITLENCVADSVSGAGYQITTTGPYSVGTGSQKIKFDNCFAGTCKIGFEITGGAIDTFISSPSTFYQGVIPPWGSPTFYKTTGNYAVARDIYLDATSSLFLSAWDADAYSSLFSGTISIAESQGFSVGSTATVAAASTVYLTTAGALASELMYFVAPKKGMVYGLTAQCGLAPGASQSFVYTLRKQLADSGTTATITGASSFSATTNAITMFNEGDVLSVKLVTSATATASNHRVGLKIAYFG